MTQRSTRARRRVRGDERCGKAAERLLRRRESVERTGVGGTFPPGGDLPHHAAAHRLVQQLADRRAVDTEHFEALVEMIGHHEPGDRVDLEARLDLVDARFRAVGAHVRRCVDQAELPARGSQQPWRDAQHARPGRQRRPGGRGDGCERNVQRAPERVEQARAGQREASGEQRMRRGHRRRVGHAVAIAGAAQPVGHRKPEQLRAHPIERGGHDIEMAHRFVKDAQRAFGCLVDQAGRHRIERVFGLQPVGDRVVQRRCRTGRQQRATAQRRRVAGDRDIDVVEIDGSQTPRLERRRVEPLDLHFPLQPHRYPGLRPCRDADQVRVDALVEREPAHLVGDLHLRLADTGFDA